MGELRLRDTHTDIGSKLHIREDRRWWPSASAAGQPLRGGGGGCVESPGRPPNGPGFITTSLCWNLVKVSKRNWQLWNFYYMLGPGSGYFKTISFALLNPLEDINWATEGHQLPKVQLMILQLYNGAKMILIPQKPRFQVCSSPGLLIGRMIFCHEAGQRRRAREHKEKQLKPYGVFCCQGALDTVVLSTFKVG